MAPQSISDSNLSGRENSASGIPRLVFVGWGAVAQRAAQLLMERDFSGITVAVAARSRPDNLPPSATWLTNPKDLAGLKPDLVVEAAHRNAVQPWGVEALACGAQLIICSTSAFCDEHLLDELVNVAHEFGSKIIIPPGALAGIDALSAACRLPMAKMHHRIVKPSRAWKGTAAEQCINLEAVEGETVFFDGSARQAANEFPLNANVAVISGLAGIGLDRTTVSLVADPLAKLNRHELHAVGDFGNMTIVIENEPLKSNPKSSEMTALSLVRAVENALSPLSI